MFGEELARYWKTIVETMPDGLMVVDTQGLIVMVNSAMAKLTGYESKELVGQSCKILDCSACRGEKSKGMDKHCALFKKEAIRRSKCSMRKKDGNLIYIIKNASVLKDGKSVIGGVETITDLSEARDTKKVISSLRRELKNKDGFHGMVGTSSVMLRVFDLISSAAGSDAPVVIYGESGTGKELVAAAIHRLGVRRDGPFIKVNCAALNESLLESELFGHVKGAFTGAGSARIGRFEAAHHGDIFLDEIGDIPLSVQVKLLRVLQEGEIEKVGDNEPVSIDARIISATNKNLMELTKDGRFREDLYYRIGVIPIYLPSLRERREDIALLVSAFINRARLKTEKPVFGMNDEALEQLNRYAWPGNVRELINVIEYAFVLCHSDEIRPEHLPRQLTDSPLSKRPVNDRPVSERSLSKNPLKKNLVRKTPVRKKSAVASDFSETKEAPDFNDQRQTLLEAMKSAGGNKSEAARILGISRVSLYKRLRKHQIEMTWKMM